MFLCYNRYENEGFGRISSCARECPLYLIFCKGFLKFGYVRTRNVHFSLFFARESGGEQNNRIWFTSFGLRLPHENDENVAAA